MDDDEHGNAWEAYRESTQKSFVNSTGVDSLDPSKSFYENGGSSLTAVSTFLQLQQDGHEISLDGFIRSISFQAPTDFQFVPRNLSTVSASDAQMLLAKCFLKKGELERSLDILLTLEDFLPMYQRVWPKVLKYGFAFVDQHNELRSVAMMADSAELLDLSFEGLHPSIIDLNDYLEAVAAHVESLLPDSSQKGTVMTKWDWGTALGNTETENVYLMYLMSKYAHEETKKAGFYASISENTNPVTQQLSEFFGCRRLLVDKPGEWINSRGMKPFAKIGAGSVVTVDVKVYAR